MCVLLNHARSYKEHVEPVSVHKFIVYQFMETTCTVVCSKFVPWVFVLHFMATDLYVA